MPLITATPPLWTVLRQARVYIASRKEAARAADQIAQETGGKHLMTGPHLIAAPGVEPILRQTDTKWRP